jgi:putative N6-adenine-specific DNA methylase
VSAAGTGSTLFVTCAAGVEALLADELVRIVGAPANVRPSRSGVELAADVATAMRINLHSRLAMRVLWRVAEAPYRDEQALYDMARAVRWADWITPRQTLRVDTTAQRSPLKSLHFAALRIKDAVCDASRESAGGQRPSVDTRHPDLPLLLHLGEQRAALYVDTSGEALFKRGWREVKGDAPLKETLAAAMLAAAGWQGREEDGPLLDPCCGAGTIAIEAAQIACGIAPGSMRRFAFERLAPFRAQAALWRDMQQAAKDAVHASAVAIDAGDVSFRMTDFATRNAERAGVAAAIVFKTADALQRSAPHAAGTMMLNPPYGERIDPKGRGSGASREDFEGVYADPRALGTAPAPRGGERPSSERPGDGRSADAGAFYSALAAHWKRQYAGWTAWVLSPEMKLPGLMRLKESRRVPLWNGPIECRLFRFDLVAGSAR